MASRKQKESANYICLGSEYPTAKFEKTTKAYQKIWKRSKRKHKGFFITLRELSAKNEKTANLS